MSCINDISEFGFWKGFFVAHWGRRGETLWIELAGDPDRQLVCAGCGGVCRSVHDTTRRIVRDLPILDAPVLLAVPRCRVACPDCGPKLERLPWLDRHARMTRRLVESVVRLVAVLPISQVAAFFDLHWSTVKAIDKRHLEATLPPLSADGLEVLAMDEFALHKATAMPLWSLTPVANGFCGSAVATAGWQSVLSSKPWARQGAVVSGPWPWI